MRRKGELSPAGIDHGWPYQVALPARLCERGGYQEIHEFCKDLTPCTRGHTVFHDRDAEALRITGVLLTFNISKELRSGEAELLAGARLIQFMIGGVDFIPLGELPEGVPEATNGGGYAESMAEHAVAMALAVAKRPILEHENLKRGQFNQFTRNRLLAGGVCGIFGFGGIGAATARLMYGIGMRVYAINRHGRTDVASPWSGTRPNSHCAACHSRPLCCPTCQRRSLGHCSNVTPKTRPARR